LPEETITHWHGLHVPMLMDGHPAAAIDPGETYVYEFEIRNRAGMYFYHPHTHEKTATQVYRGLAGAMIVEDEEERALGLPSGEFEIPLVIQDRAFDGDNQLAYGGDMHTSMFGFYGDRVLVNGRRNLTLDVAGALIVCGSSTARMRVYKLCWDDRTPLTVIGVDGGLLEKAETRPYVMLAPAERVDLIVDFSGRPQGAKLTMLSGEFYGLIPPMAQRMMGSDLAMGEEFPLFTARVTKASTDSWKLPEKLSTIRRFRRKIANRRSIDRDHHARLMAMFLNGDLARSRRRPAARTYPRRRRSSSKFSRAWRHGRMGMQGRGMMGGGMMGRMGGMGWGMGHDGNDVDGASHPFARPALRDIERSFEGDEDAYASIRDASSTAA
jgi:FtsP/CotA-like multicopper oxidase with cupredoxin domain